MEARTLGWVVAVGWESHRGTPNWALQERALEAKRSGDLDLVGVEHDEIKVYDIYQEVDFSAFCRNGHPTLRKSVKAAFHYAWLRGCRRVVFYCHPLMRRRLQRVLATWSEFGKDYTCEIKPVPGWLYIFDPQPWVRLAPILSIREWLVIGLEWLGVPIGAD